MKKLSALAFSLAYIAVLASLLTSCSSDPNPVDFIRTDGYSKDAKTYIQLSLNPAATRAGDEDAISVVDLYVFKEDGTLENVVADIDYKENLVLDLGVTTGKKTVYAITANKILPNKMSDDELNGISLDNFKIKSFESLVENLNNADGLVMSGMGEIQNLSESNSPLNIPASNNLTIRLERLLAKVEVTGSITQDNTYGFAKIDDPSFKVCQINKKMQLVPVEISSADLEDENENGVYDNYEQHGSDYIAINSTDAQPQYMTENLVANPTSGNTTFLSFKVRLTPSKVWYLSGTNWGEASYSTTGSGTSVVKTGDTFFAIGIYDKKNILIGFIKNSNDNDKIVCFRTSQACEKFISNGTYTISKPAALPDGCEYKPIEYTNGYAYYRVNISDGADDAKKYRVLRNAYYKLKIGKVGSMGYAKESDLFPSDPDSSLEAVETISILSGVAFELNSWDEHEEDVDL